MRIEAFSFGSIRIDGEIYDCDVLIDRGKVRKREKKASKEFREKFEHTPLSLKESIPWNCKGLVVGTGTNQALPVMKEVLTEAKRRGIEIVMLPTDKAVEYLNQHPKETNAILHITC